MNKASNSINNVKASNNERTSSAVAPSTSTSATASLTINDYLKESKTLNVNVLVDDDEEMNNEIRFALYLFSFLSCNDNCPRGIVQWIKHLPVMQAARVRTQIRSKIFSAAVLLGTPATTTLSLSISLTSLMSCAPP